MDRYKWALAALFLVVFFSRLFFSFQVPHFSNDSYYHLRHIESVQEQGLPQFNDPLSYGGRIHYFPVLFHYIMAFFGFVFTNTAAGKVLPSLFFSVLVLLVYSISLRITKHKGYSFLAAFFFAFTPISYTFPINEISPYSLAIPLFFGILHTMLNMKEEFNWMLLLIIALIFTHPSAFLLVIGLIFYLILLKIEGMKVDNRSMEIIVFTMFLTFWTLFVLYKNVFLEYGLGVVWQNLPSSLFQAAFPSLSVFQIIYFVGMVPLFLGMIGTYGAVFQEQRKELLLLLAFAMACFTLLWLNFIRLATGLLYLSVILSILSAQGLKTRTNLMKRTKFGRWKGLTIASLVFFFIVTSIAPLYPSAMEKAQATPSQDVIDSLLWIRNNTSDDSVVLAPLSQGHLVTYFAQRKNVMDTNFIMIPDTDTRFTELSKVYTVRLKTEALRVLTKYGVNYIMLTEAARSNYGVSRIYYISDERCFSKVHEEVEIYRIRCRLRGEE